MASAGLEALLALQDVDTKIDQLRHRELTHPLRAALAEVEKQLKRQNQVVAKVEAQKHDVDRQQKRADDEVVTVRTKREELEAKMYDGSVTAIKDLQAMQEESRHLLERQTQLEDVELEIMEAVEGLSGELAAATSAADAIEAQRQTTESDLAAALSEVVAEREEFEAQRSQVVDPVPPDLITVYEKLRVDLGGVAVARLEGGTCHGCFLNLSAVTVDQIKKSPEGSVVNCDQCGRILVR